MEGHHSDEGEEVSVSGALGIVGSQGNRNAEEEQDYHIGKMVVLGCKDTGALQHQNIVATDSKFEAKV